jgi:uncharacterized membrane protein YheB (UPF0754 family)
MLFHPYEPRGPWRFKLQGAIPKNKARLARTIGRTVGQRLLTTEDLSRQLSAPGMRQAFDAAVRRFAEAALETERGSLREELPPALLAEVDGVKAGIADRVSDAVQAYVATDAFREALERFLARARTEWSDRPVGEVLTEARQTAIRARVERWVTDAAESTELDQTIRGWLERQVVRLATDRTPLLDRLPADLVAVVEKELTGYLPVALDRLAATLSDPGARARIERTLHDLFRRFVGELMLHERIVARLVVTERTITRLLDTFEREGAEQFAGLLADPEVRSQVARSINDAVVSFLQRPLAEHFARLGPERTAGLVDTAARHMTAVIRDPATRAYAIERLDGALRAAEHRTWGELLQHLPADRAARWAADVARTPKLRAWVRDATVAALDALLDRRIGRPAAILPTGSVDRLAQALTPALWSWIEVKVPEIVGQVDVQTVVEQKVLGFSLTRIEEIVRATTQRELDLIIRLGYVLGAGVGAVAYTISLLLP